MRVAVGVLLVALAVLAMGLIHERQRNEDRSKQVAELTSRLSEKASRERLELQEKCALQAEKVFRSMGYKLQSDGLQSHYHPQKGHCYMVVAPFPISRADGSIFKSVFLLDAYEQKSIANYAWGSQTGKQYWEVPPVVCSFAPSVGNEVGCKSEEEFERLIAAYME